MLSIREPVKGPMGMLPLISMTARLNLSSVKTRSEVFNLSVFYLMNYDGKLVHFEKLQRSLLVLFTVYGFFACWMLTVYDQKVDLQVRKSYIMPVLLSACFISCRTFWNEGRYHIYLKYNRREGWNELM